MQFSLPDSYIAGSLRVFKNGLMEPSENFTEIPPDKFEMEDPISPDIITCNYDVAGTGTLDPEEQILHKKRVTPDGDIDGLNKNFVTPTPYLTNSLRVFKNGLQETPNYVTEIPPSEFELDTAPLIGDTIEVDYASEATRTL